jgi:hypothetical protein
MGNSSTKALEDLRTQFIVESFFKIKYEKSCLTIDIPSWVVFFALDMCEPATFLKTTPFTTTVVFFECIHVPLSF